MYSTIFKYAKSIRNLIIDSYQSYFYIKTLLKYKPNHNLPFHYYPYLNFYNFNMRNLKEHLALNIFKIYYDKNLKALTIDKLNTEIYLSNQLKLKLNKIKHNKFELQITNIRKESIAHNDTLKNKYSITLNEIYELLVEIRKNYNLICKNFKAIKSINNFFISKVRKESEVAVELVFNGYIANLNKQNEP